MNVGVVRWCCAPVALSALVLAAVAPPASSHGGSYPPPTPLRATPASAATDSAADAHSAKIGDTVPNRPTTPPPAVRALRRRRLPRRHDPPPLRHRPARRPRPRPLGQACLRRPRHSATRASTGPPGSCGGTTTATRSSSTTVTRTSADGKRRVLPRARRGPAATACGRRTCSSHARWCRCWSRSCAATAARTWSRRRRSRWPRRAWRAMLAGVTREAVADGAAPARQPGGRRDGRARRSGIRGGERRVRAPCCTGRRRRGRDPSTLRVDLGKQVTSGLAPSRPTPSAVRGGADALSPAGGGPLAHAGFRRRRGGRPRPGQRPASSRSGRSPCRTCPTTHVPWSRRAPCSVRERAQVRYLAATFGNAKLPDPSARQAALAAARGARLLGA